MKYLKYIKEVKLLSRRKENFKKLTPKTNTNENKGVSFSNLSVYKDRTSRERGTV